MKVLCCWNLDAQTFYKFLASIFCVAEPGPTGWCATCVANATEGQPGFCGRASSDEITDEELPAPTANKGWGYCHTSCKGWAPTHGLYNKRKTNQGQLHLIHQNLYKYSGGSSTLCLCWCWATCLILPPPFVVQCTFEKGKGEAGS